jgi:hypothetical protein
MVQFVGPDGKLMIRPRTGGVAVPLALLGGGELRYQSQAEGQLVLASRDGSAIVLRGTNEQLNGIAATIMQFNETGSFNTQKFLAELQVRVDSQNADAINARTNAIASIQAKLAEALGSQDATYTQSQSIDAEMNTVRNNLKTAEQELAAAGARATDAEKKRVSDLRGRLFELQSKYFSVVGDNVGAGVLGTELRTLLDQQRAVQLVTMPDVQINAPSIQLRGMNPNASSAAPGAAYRPSTRQDDAVESVIGASMTSPVNPRRSRNLNA